MAGQSAAGAALAFAADGSVASSAPVTAAGMVTAAELKLQEVMKKQAMMNSVTAHLTSGDETAALGCLMKIMGMNKTQDALAAGKIASQEVARMKAQNCK